jgi:hypothetical protein
MRNRAHRAPCLAARVTAEFRLMLVRPIGKPKLTLAQKLKAFDPKIHGGEAMRSPLNETNPFAVKFTPGKGEVNYVLAHQPKSCDWHARRARPHPLKQVPETVFEAACEELNGIISICA